MDAVVKTVTINEVPVIDKTHPPVISAFKFAADQGVLDRGLLIAFVDGSDEAVAYDPLAADGTQNIKGVLTTQLDTTGEVKVASVLEHGTAVGDNLHVSGVALTAAQTAELKAFGIFPR